MCEFQKREGTYCVGGEHVYITGDATCCCCCCFPGVTTHCGCIFHSPVAGFSLLVLEVSWSHTTTRHSRQDFSGRMINPSQRPLPDYTQHSQQTSMPPVEFEPTIAAGERPKTYALDRAATGTGWRCDLVTRNVEPSCDDVKRIVANNTFTNIRIS